MTERRQAMLWVAGWLLVVALATVLVWVVISRVGNEVVSAPVQAPAADPTPRSRTPTGTSTATATSTVAPTASGSATATPQPTEPTGPTGSSGSSGPSGPTAPTVPAVERRTWEGVAGRVVVACGGPAIGLGGAQPAAGYAVEVDDRGPDRVEVEFEAGDDSDTRVRVRASCVGGVPTFEVDD